MNCCMAVFLVSTRSCFNNLLSFLGTKVTNCRTIGSQVVFMDCIERNDLNREQAGRINLYSDKLVKQLLCEQPIQQVDGMKKRKITKVRKGTCKTTPSCWCNFLFLFVPFSRRGLRRGVGRVRSR